MAGKIPLSSILFLGSPGPEGSHNVYWGSNYDCNPADYEAVVIDCVSLLSSLKLRVQSGGSSLNEALSPLGRLRERIEKLLSTKGTVVIICDSDREVEGVNCLGWLPVNFRMVPNKGTTLIVKMETWKSYFSHIDPWTFHFQLPTNNPISAYNPGDKSDIVPLAVNRAGEYLGVKLSNQSNPKIGELYLIPAPSDRNMSSAIGVILRDLFGIGVSSELPKWADDIPIPGLNEIEQSINENGNQIEKLQQEIVSLEAERSKKAKWRGLLYESGYTLEVLCREAFHELGFNTVQSDVSDEFIIQVDGKEILTEIKGVGKSAAKSHLGQLLIDSEKRSEDRRFSGLLLVVNAWREEPLKNRGTNNKPWFPSDVVKTAEAAGIILLGTDVLLDALRSHWDRRNGRDIVNGILNTKGLFNL